jgi:cob(I)alamin adenosyltransferase
VTTEDEQLAPTSDPRPDAMRSAPSLVLVNTGNGKGKSSAAFGVMLRAVAVDWKVAVLQFVKSGDWKVGEEKIGRQLGVDWRSFGDGFTWDSDNLDNDKSHARAGWAEAKALIEAGEHSS